LPKVAYHRRLSAEGVLSLDPTVVIATTEVGPPEVIQQIKSTGVTMLILLLEPPVENTISNIQRIATLLKVEEVGASLVARLQKTRTRQVFPSPPIRPKPKCSSYIPEAKER
jgi:iron complex transport system substrate-binding protein